ncbi:peptidoglycan-binding protein [Ruegeria sediminis]|uniref:Peptidoglycan-binding protein n=1 Tax=Ruegeria sediminis TaxID=2583820 RepID=A0ABY2X3G4_9RHOB|nr:serine protease [Ruegeria sediminis]TMV09520.1 peptidoglycan-binding protein [Ruegeria sediminis]
MVRAFTTVVFLLFCGLRAAFAQQAQDEGVWVQIEALPTLQQAQERAQDYSDALADVNGFRLGSGWYAIVLGPYLRSDAEQVLRVYRAERQIPADSFLAFSGSFGQQFWPIGANLLDRAAVTPPVEQSAQPQQPEIVRRDEPADETRAEALRSEQLLSGQERMDLQIALQAAGFYNAAIDGAFGPGTRRSMQDWQLYNGFEATGILTTRQRKLLMDDYNEPLISVGMKRYTDREAGIEMHLPLGAVEFSRHEAPFAHFDSSSDLGARVLLISQKGTEATLRGLYEVMQTLEIVPLDGPRERSRNSFVLQGQGNGIVSHTEAELRDGQIKGFTLVWPEGDEARRARVLAAMKASFNRIDGVLPDTAGADAEQRIDLVAGLNIRKPRLSRSGFYVDATGAVLTVAEVADGCARITLDGRFDANVAARNDDLGVALLRPVQALAPITVAQLGAAGPRISSEVAASGYSYEGALGAPTLTFGKVSDVRGLNGEAGISRLELAAQAGDAGGPVFDEDGNVVGMLLPAPAKDKALPRNVSFAADAASLTRVLADAGMRGREAQTNADISPDELSNRASGMTVLVSCWD